ncbi:MAG: hypothetical protein ACYC99_17045 [Candidatus Geothermincolia bacterium]
MTIPMDCAITFTMGNLFAVAGSGAIESGDEGAKACLDRSRAFTAMVAVPVGFYFWKRWPDWSCMYLMGERSSSPIVGGVGLGSYVASNELGFRHAARLIREGRTDEAAIRGVASLSLLALVSAVGWRRFRWQGTCEQYESGEAIDIFKSGDFWVSILASAAVFVAGAAFVFIRNYRERGRQ